MLCQIRDIHVKGSYIIMWFQGASSINDMIHKGMYTQAAD